MKRSRTSMLKEVEAAILLMPAISKKLEATYASEMRFSRKIFGSTLKEILKYRLAK
ncbi:MAG TPA: hypothetical protein VK826_13365 [Bacteroidia bacterium]|nr:hypothetical protein [Bacteroidia bacterium]